MLIQRTIFFEICIFNSNLSSKLQTNINKYSIFLQGKGGLKLPDKMCDAQVNCSKRVGQTNTKKVFIVYLTFKLS